MKHNTKFYFRNEKEVMKSLGLTPTKGSGSGWIEKEDGQNEYLIAQLKSTEAESIRIKFSDIKTLEYNASVAHKVPVFVVEDLNTKDLYLVAKPFNIPVIAKYIETGKCEKQELEIDYLNEYTIKSKEVIKTGNRSSFWQEKERERKGWQKRK